MSGVSSVLSLQRLILNALALVERSIRKQRCIVSDSDDAEPAWLLLEHSIDIAWMDAAPSESGALD
jgi:hypothetical protein